MAMANELDGNGAHGGRGARCAWVALAICLALTIWAAPAAAAANAKEADLQQRVAGLIKDLGDNSFRIREDAQTELIRIGPPAIPQLEQAMSSEDAEIRLRAGNILPKIRKQAAEQASEAIRKRLLWSFTARGSLAGEAVVAGKAVLCIDSGGRLTGIDAGTGKHAWSFAAAPGARAAAAGDTIYVAGSDKRLHSLDARTGEPKAGFTSSPAAGNPAAAGGVVYVLDGEGQLRAMDGQTGKTNWSAPLGAKAASAPAPVVAGDSVFAVDGDGALHCLSRDAGKSKWTVKDLGAVKALAHDGGRVILRAGGRVDAIDAGTGKRAWAVDLPAGSNAGGLRVQRQMLWVNGKRIVTRAQADESIVISGDSVHLSHQGQLICLDAKTGKQRWAHKPNLAAEAGGADEDGGVVRVQGVAQANVAINVLIAGRALTSGLGGTGITAPAVLGRVLCFGGPDGLRAIDARTGELLWRYKTPCGVVGRPVVANGVIYFCTGGIFRTPGAAGNANLYALSMKAAK